MDTLRIKLCSDETDFKATHVQLIKDKRKIILSDRADAIIAQFGIVTTNISGDAIWLREENRDYFILIWEQ